MAVERAKRLTPEEFAAEAAPAFHRVFKTFKLRDANLKEEIFQDIVTEGVVLECDTHFLFWRQFAALSEVARSLGDDSILYTILYAERPPHELTWRLPLIRYEEYSLADERIPRSEQIGIPLERVLYSPQGLWGVFSDDPHSIVGGNAEFISLFKTEYPDWWGDLAQFTKTMREAGSQRGMDVTWVQPLLSSLYGSDAPTFETMTRAEEQA